ncbi:MAG: hypothetical protein ACK4SY_09305 [Pyrobaculum sp.]
MGVVWDCDKFRKLKYADLALAPVVFGVLWWAGVDVFTAAAMVALVTVPPFLYLHSQEKKFCD